MRIRQRINAAERKIWLSDEDMVSVFLLYFCEDYEGPPMAWALSQHGPPIVERLAGEVDEDFHQRAVDAARAMGKQGLLVFFEVAKQQEGRL